MKVKVNTEQLVNWMTEMDARLIDVERSLEAFVRRLEDVGTHPGDEGWNE